MRTKATAVLRKYPASACSFDPHAAAKAAAAAAAAEAAAARARRAPTGFSPAVPSGAAGPPGGRAGAPGRKDSALDLAGAPPLFGRHSVPTSLLLLSRFLPSPLSVAGAERSRSRKREPARILRLFCFLRRGPAGRWRAGLATRRRRRRWRRRRRRISARQRAAAQALAAQQRLQRRAGGGGGGGGAGRARGRGDGAAASAILVPSRVGHFGGPEAGRPAAAAAAGCRGAV